jgi:putative membrane protein
MIAFLLPGVVFLIPLMLETLAIGNTWGVSIASSFLPVWQVQILVFVSLALIFRWQPVKMRLIPRAVKQRRSNRLAYEQFYMQGVHLTQHRTGILLFVSVAEHYVEIIADQGICEKVEAKIWQEGVDQFVGDVKSGNIAQGFLNSIEQCGKPLIHYFPAEPGNINELSDHLVQL